MKVVGLLSFFDEQVDHLIGAVSSVATAGVDHVVAVDGAYALFPDGTARSGREQHEAICDTAAMHGIGCTVHVPPVVWAGNEVEKRTFLFKLGHAHCDPYDDWLLVFDADETVTHAGDWRAELERTSCDVGAVLHGEPGVRPRSERRLFRAHPRGISVRRAHFFYVDGDERVLWGPQQIDRDLVDMQILHQPRTRSPERNARRNGYYESRLLSNAEVALW